MNAEVLTWGWKEQPDLDALSRIVREMSSGKVYIHEVATGSNEFAIVIADRPLGTAGSYKVYEQRFNEDAQARLDAAPETGKKIDEFLSNPETGVQRERKD